MIILPERNAPRGRVLLPQRRLEWDQPSARSTTFGIPNKTWFRVRVREPLSRRVRWQGWTEDREDADAFLWAYVSGFIKYDRKLWRLTQPEWTGDLNDALDQYECMIETFNFLTSTGAQTYTVPSDYTGFESSWECIGGGGGSAYGVANVSGGMPGGGGGAFAGVRNKYLAPSSTCSYTVGAGSASNAFAAGGDTWFNGTSLAASTVGAKGGGYSNQTGTFGTYVAGGSAASSIGTTTYNGGAGGLSSTNSANGGGGGGGAASQFGAGGNGGASSSIYGGGGGAGGGPSGVNASGTTVGASYQGTGAGSSWGGTAGGAGKDYPQGYGAGGGGGGAYDDGSGTYNPGAGGLYGGGGGGGGNSGALNTAGAAGAQGIIIVCYIASTKQQGFLRRQSPLTGGF